MLRPITVWWEKNGFALLVFGSLTFLLLCWIMGWKPKKGRADKFNWNLLLGDTSFSPQMKKKRNPKKSEERCREIVEDIFQKPFPSVRPDFLKNPETGRNMECDLMNTELKLCIERNGEQHYKHVDHFHTKEEFSKQCQRDKLKKELLEKNGYKLLTIPYTVHYDVLDKYIVQMLKEDYQPYVERYLSG